MSTQIALTKDWKPICDIKCPNPPAQLPNEWNISSIIKKKISNISELPQFRVTPTPKSSRDKDEWGKFLNFLQKYDKVAIIRFGQYQFYILPPVAKVSTSCRANVAYLIDHKYGVDTRPKDCESRVPDTLTVRGPSNSNGEDVCSSYLKLPPDEACGRIQSQNFIRADPSYLKTLAQAHSGWIFGGIAELVDNSRNAIATKIDIFVDMIKMKKSGKDIPMLSVIDDGLGMNHDELVKMVSFGHKDQNGRFGVGFKTGAMRLGRDVLVLTQTANSRSIAFLSQSLNEGKDNIRIPIISYCLQGQSMEIDTNAQPETLEKYNLKAIKKFSPFNEYLIGEKAALFRGGTGTQIYIWNLDECGSKYSLEWHEGLKGGSSFHQGDIFIQSKTSRSRLGQTNQKVPLDYSLRSYLEVIFLVPRIKMSVQGALVKSRPLANFLTKTVIETGDILGRPVELILGFSHCEWDQASCGIFLYWHGRLIEAYKRVGSMIHNADMGRGVIGVIDVTNLMDDQDGRMWVHNNKQGFQDCEAYACLEQWLGERADEYWDNNFDSLNLDKDNYVNKPDCEWVQCDKCRKWRLLSSTFDSRNLPKQWFCYMEPFKGQCPDVEQEMRGIVNVSTKRSRYYSMLEHSNHLQKIKSVKNVSGTDDKLVNSEDVKFPFFMRLKKRKADFRYVLSKRPRRSHATQVDVLEH